MIHLLAIVVLWFCSSVVLCGLYVMVRRHDRIITETATDECWGKGIEAYRASTLKRSRQS